MVWKIIALINLSLVCLSVANSPPEKCAAVDKLKTGKCSKTYSSGNSRIPSCMSTKFKGKWLSISQESEADPSAPYKKAVVSQSWRRPIIGEADTLPPEGFLGSSSQAPVPTCALVGEKAHMTSLQGGGVGAAIDAHDLVMRVNRATVAGYESDLGSKTTVRFVNMLNLRFREGPGEVVVASWCQRPPCQRAELMQVLRGRAHPLNPTFLSYTKFKSLKLPPRDEFVAAVLLTHVCQSVSIYGLHLPSTWEFDLGVKLAGAGKGGGARDIEGKCLQSMLSNKLIQEVKSSSAFKPSMGQSFKAFSAAVLEPEQEVLQQESAALASETESQNEENPFMEMQQAELEQERLLQERQQQEDDAKVLGSRSTSAIQGRLVSPAGSGGPGVRRYQLRANRVAGGGGGGASGVGTAGGSWGATKKEREQEWSDSSQAQAQALLEEEIVGIESVEVMSQADKKLKNKMQSSISTSPVKKTSSSRIHELKTAHDLHPEKSSRGVQDAIEAASHLYEVQPTQEGGDEGETALGDISEGDQVDAAETPLDTQTQEESPVESAPVPRAKARPVKPSAKAVRSARREELLKSLNLWDKVQEHESQHKEHKQAHAEIRAAHAEAILNDRKVKKDISQVLG